MGVILQDGFLCIVARHAQHEVGAVRIVQARSADLSGMRDITAAASAYVRNIGGGGAHEAASALAMRSLSAARRAASLQPLLSAQAQRVSNLRRYCSAEISS